MVNCAANYAYGENEDFFNFFLIIKKFVSRTGRVQKERIEYEEKTIKRAPTPHTKTTQKKIIMESPQNYNWSITELELEYRVRESWSRCGFHWPPYWK